MSELKVINGDGVIVNDNALSVVEYKGVRVISSYDIARLHQREVKRVNEQFERNRKYLEEGVDYFIISKEEFEATRCLLNLGTKMKGCSQNVDT